MDELSEKSEMKGTKMVNVLIIMALLIISMICVIKSKNFKTPGFGLLAIIFLVIGICILCKTFF